MRLRFFMLIVLALFTVTIVAQTDNLPDLWAFDEQCVGERIAPPSNWTFDGAVLLTGQYGIHVIDNMITTPYVVAFLSDVVPGGSLSADGLWYASLRGAPNGQTDSPNVWDVFQLRLYSLTAQREDLFESLVQSYNYGLSTEDHMQLHWLDTTTLLYDSSEIVDEALEIMPMTYNLDTDETVLWESPVNPFTNATGFFPSPNSERAIFNASESPFDPAQWQAIDIASGQVIAEPELADFIEPVWAPDSTQFVAEIEQETDDDFVYTLALFAADGSLTERVITFDAGERVRASFDANMHHVRWSPDGRYLAFITSTVSFPTNITLYIADTQTRTVRNTCLWTENGIAWSPDSTQIALFPRLVYDPRQELLIFDTADWALYGSGRRHDGNIIGWRE